MTSINLNGWAMNSTFRRAARAADSSEHGNNNNKLDTDSERAYFKKLIKNTFDYDFDLNGNIEDQDWEISHKHFQNPYGKTEGMKFLDVNRDFFDNLYRYIGKDAGKDAGSQVRRDLVGFTNSKEAAFVKRTIARINEDYGDEHNNMIIKNFLNGYYGSMDSTDSGLFEQLGSENDSSKITNKEACILLKRILDAVPNDKKESNDFKRVQEAYNEYSSKGADELFKDKSGNIARIFGRGYLDNLDDSIERLFDL